MEKQKKIIILIEDNPLLAGMYSAAFQGKGLEVRVAHDGQTGLDFVKKEKPDIVLLDLYMPGLDGFHVLEALKASPETKGIKVIVLTISTREEDKIRAKSLGAEEYLTKPDLKLNEIVEKVLAKI